MIKKEKIEVSIKYCHVPTMLNEKYLNGKTVVDSLSSQLLFRVIILLYSRERRYEKIYAESSTKSQVV